MSMHDLKCDGCKKEKIIEKTEDVENITSYYKRVAGKATRISLNIGHFEVSGYDHYLLCASCFDNLKALFKRSKTDGITCNLCRRKKGYNYLFHLSSVFSEEKWTFCEDCKFKILPHLDENPYILKTVGAKYHEEPMIDDFYKYKYKYTT